jgi:hypothetical protein
LSAVKIVIVDMVNRSVFFLPIRSAKIPQDNAPTNIPKYPALNNRPETSGCCCNPNSLIIGDNTAAMSNTFMAVKP